MFTFFFFNDTATTEIYTLSLHDALPIYFLHEEISYGKFERTFTLPEGVDTDKLTAEDRKSTRLNSSHSQISYAVFCLKKKKIRGEYPARPADPDRHSYSAVERCPTESHA